jgi:hypothetical protein
MGLVYMTKTAGAVLNRRRRAHRARARKAPSNIWARTGRQQWHPRDRAVHRRSIRKGDVEFARRVLVEFFGSGICAFNSCERLVGLKQASDGIAAELRWGMQSRLGIFPPKIVPRSRKC